MIWGYVPLGAGLYMHYKVSVIQWQRALVVNMLLGQVNSWLCCLSEVSTPSDVAGRSRQPWEKLQYHEMMLVVDVAARGWGGGRAGACPGRRRSVRWPDDRLAAGNTGTGNSHCWVPTGITLAIKKSGNLPYTIHTTSFGPIKRLSFLSIIGYTHLQCLIERAFPPFCRASDVISSSVDKLIHQDVILIRCYLDSKRDSFV